MSPRYLSNDHNPGQDVRLHLHCMESRVERAPEIGKYTSSSAKGLYPPSAYTAYPDGEDVDESNIGMNIGMMNKLGMRMNPTLVFLEELKMNLKQLW